ncbi:hypothetical protein A2Z23_00240 [Candidatus Curtissbacteria bacterium RBG_16_39_7]|uniref:Uncharacterized protein n=1 Tax=Candidatus Curtissbacteria bacterium RBG_16_39_7 TaxID=1797707 RepID=A0A1F5G366_9BACT|nr:MAG: hypothetical protein A2Z23_00240 [Candidatus Curtissbacteria bacterium RBG_16_39_7]
MKRIVIVLFFLILISILILIGFLNIRKIYYEHNPLPSERTRAIRDSIPRYPNATRWEIEAHRGGCNWGSCSPPAYLIFFDTTDSRNEVLDFYLPVFLKNFGSASTKDIDDFRHETFGKSNLVVFENLQKCYIQLNNFYQGTIDKYDQGQYSFDLRCRDDLKY